MCEMIMLGEDIPKQLKTNGTLEAYPGHEESEDDEDIDAMAESYDIQMGKKSISYYSLLFSAFTIFITIIKLRNNIIYNFFLFELDMEFGHRQRSNTAARLEKMDIEKKKASKIKHIKWEPNAGNSLSPTECAELFQRKDLRKKESKEPRKQSLLSEQLEKCPNLPQNPFIQYSKFDGLVKRFYNYFVISLFL